MHDKEKCDFNFFVESLFRRYYLSLRAYAYRFLNDYDEAEDIVQEVFLEISQRTETLEIDNPKMKSYLFTSVYNRCLNQLSYRGQRRNLSLSDNNNENVVHTHLDRFCSDQDQECILMLEEINHAIKSVVQKLPPQCKKIFLLSRTYHLKNKEIADQLNISVKAVEKQLTKAIFIIKQDLVKNGFYTLLVILTLFNIY